MRKHTPAGQLPLACASTSSGKCFMTEAIGTGTTWPRPQIDVIFSAWESSSYEREVVRAATPLRPLR